MVKHWSNHHVGEGNPSFRFNIVKRYKTALTRQVGEAVRIELRAIARRWEKAGAAGEERIGKKNYKRHGTEDTGRKMKKLKYY